MFFIHVLMFFICKLMFLSSMFCASTHDVAHWRQDDLHATISSVVSRYRPTRLDSFVVKHVTLFLWTTNLEAVSVLLLYYSCAFIPQLAIPPTYTFNSRVSHPCQAYLVPRFPLPRFQRPQINFKGLQTTNRRFLRHRISSY